MVDEVHTKYADWPLLCFFFLCIKDTPSAVGQSKVEHSTSYTVCRCWLLAAVFVSAASTPKLGAFVAVFTL